MTENSSQLSQFKSKLDLAGITLDLYQLANAHSRPKRVNLVKDRLVWTGRGALVSPSPQMLEGFIRLAEAPPEKIREYALQWGVLETCEHNMPLWHWGDERCTLVREGDGWSEPLSVWRFYARNARAVLRVAAEIRSHDHARLSSWEELWEQLPGLRAHLAGGV